MILLVQILGGTLGLATAWLINYGFTKYQEKKLDKLRLQHKLELENYKKSLLKSR